MHFASWGVVTLVLLCIGAPLQAEERAEDPAPKPLAPEAAADAVLEAVDAEDANALEALAATLKPDPWEVADRLCARGAREAALALARVHPGRAATELEAYVTNWRGRAEDSEAEAVLAAARGEAWTEVIRRTEEEDPGRSRVMAHRLLVARGFALRELRRASESVAVFESASTTARAIGWLAGADAALSGAEFTASRSGAYVLALDLATRRVGVARARESVDAEVDALLCLAGCQSRLRRLDQALTLCEEALVRVREAGQPALELRVLGDMASVRFEASAFKDALDLQQQGLVLAERLGRTDQQAILLGNLGNTYHRLGDHPNAARHHEQALDLFRALDDRLGVARTHGNLGLLYADQGRLEEAAEAFAPAATVAERVGHLPLCAVSLQNLANTLAALGRREDALAANERERRVRDAMGDRAGAVYALGRAGLLCFDLERYEAARTFHERALALARELGIHHIRPVILGNLANAHQSLGHYAEAMRLQREALSISRATGDRMGVARALLNLGTIHVEQGRFAEALVVQEEALAMLDPEGESPMLAVLLDAMGNTYASLGDGERAEACQERALALHVHMGDRIGQARTLANIGSRHFDAGRHEEALAAEGKALALAKSLGMRELSALLRGNMANSRFALGQTAEAIGEMERALALFRGLDDQGRIAWALGNLGEYHRREGAYEHALRCLVEGAAVAERLGQVPSLSFILHTRACTHLAAGDPAAAARDARRVSRLLFDLFGGLADEQGATARARFAWVFDVGVRAGVALEDAAEVAYFMEAGRAGSLLEALENRDAIRDAAIPPALRKAEADARTAEAKASAAHETAMRSGRRREARQCRARLDAARERVTHVAERIQRKAKRAAGVLAPEAIPLDRLQPRLGEGEVLVLYALLEPEAYALVLTREEARIVDLGPSAPIDEACEALSGDAPSSLGRPRGRVVVDRARKPEDAAASVLERLRTLLIEPLSLSKETTRLLVSPDGGLGHAPFALLAPLCEVAYLPSATTYDLLLTDRLLEGEGVLALGDPDYETNVDERAVSRLRGGMKLTPLPATRDEALAVGSVQLLGEHATEGRLSESLADRARWRAVHFACHGLVDAERPSFSSLAITRGGGGDGFLTAMEVYGLEVNADLVVLSACETGRGKVLRSEGIIGLTRAFMFAGAPRVLVSLWKVDDKATQALMVKFYELWNPKGGRGLGAAAALKQAQAFVRSHEQWEHAYYWAAWVLWGLPQ